jgi:phosphatidylserine/phosphatidylglycerophosphate/cardiolipin synthase-like enzyme
MLEAIQRLCLRPRPTTRDALFFPGGPALSRLLHLISTARFSIDVCVYCVTDDSLVRALQARAAAGISVRLVTDDEQAFNRGAALFKMALFAYAVVDEPSVPDEATGRQVRGRSIHP